MIKYINLFYEIKIKGYPYDTGIDMWSAACTIYEIYVGRVNYINFEFEFNIKFRKFFISWKR